MPGRLLRASLLLILLSTALAARTYVGALPAFTTPFTSVADASCTITGTDAGERLRGTKGPDVICGLGGDDILIGVDGNDTLLGAEGNDVLQGGPGNDQLFGGGGNDMVQPGTGDDGPVDGGTEIDTLDYTDLKKGPGVSARLSAADSWYSSGGGGTDQILAGFEHLNGSKFDDPLLRSELPGVASVVRGFAGDDTLDTSDTGGPDTTDGGRGTDRCVTDLTDEILTCEPFVNQPPVADETFRPHTNEEVPVTITLPLSDPDGETIDAYATGPDSNNGQLYQVNPDGTRGAQITTSAFQRVTDPFLRLVYVPEPFDFGTPVTFIRYYAEDSSGATSTPAPPEGTIMFIDVAFVNDPPDAVSITHVGFNLFPRIPLTLQYLDPDPDDVVTGRFTVLPQNGKFYRNSVAPESEITAENNAILPSDNGYIYVQPWPADCRAPRPFGLNFDSFAYEVTDGEYTDSATGTIDIRYLNEPPVVDGPLSLSTTKDQGTTWWFDATDPDPEHDKTKLVLRILDLPEHGTLVYHCCGQEFELPEGEGDRFDLGWHENGASMEYRPDAGYTGPDSFKWTVSDPERLTPWCGDTTTTVSVQAPPAPSPDA